MNMVDREIAQQMAKLDEKVRLASRLPSLWLCLVMIVEAAGTVGGLLYLAHWSGYLP